eukprot:TRINITY_DN7970_c0_g1_i1.p1 TRINITY_DN7970_c0_g1~~TRINITY_DN7970_c0_g1_i1.p1  ORF type:complete len:315 (+),score=65.96 TRINITY_DN7970_c0_g1_i1:48-947(+)
MAAAAAHAAKLDAVVTAATVEAFQRDGAVLLKGLFSNAPWIEDLRKAVDANRASPGPLHKVRTPPGKSGELFVDFQLWQRHRAARDFVFQSPAAAAMARLMRSDRVWYYHDHLLVKEPGTEERTPWHHDQPYYPVDGEMVASLWLPLDHVPEEIAVSFVAGSHRWGREFAPVFFDPNATALDQSSDGASRRRFEPVPPDFEEQLERDGHRLLRWATSPGDVIAFHAKTMHAASGNPAEEGADGAPRRRRAWATRWFGHDARFAQRPEGMLVSPNLQGHGLTPGEQMGSSSLFPLAWPTE